MDIDYHHENPSGKHQILPSQSNLIYNPTTNPKTVTFEILPTSGGTATSETFNLDDGAGPTYTFSRQINPTTTISGQITVRPGSDPSGRINRSHTDHPHSDPGLTPENDTGSYTTTHD
jgi:hypothetical protein